MFLANKAPLSLMAILLLTSCQPIDPDKRQPLKLEQTSAASSQQKAPVKAMESIIRSSSILSPQDDSEVIRQQYGMITTGLKELKELNDPSIELVFAKIDEIMAQPSVTITDLFQIESLISKNKKQIAENADLIIQQELRQSFISDVYKIKHPEPAKKAKNAG